MATARNNCVFKDLKPTQVPCPWCGAGVFEPVRGRFGPLWRCCNHPHCKYVLSSKPTGRYCQHPADDQPCGALMVEGTKTIPERCSRKECPNRHPHRLKKAH